MSGEADLIISVADESLRDGFARAAALLRQRGRMLNQFLIL
jgi:hypothetical protein